jgi:hypothetical protein
MTARVSRSRLLALVLAALPVLAPAADAGGPFDGRWEVTLTCPPHHEDDDAKGYVHRFPAEVRNSILRGVHGSEGQPSWHLLTGPIDADGNARLELEGIVNNPAYAINNAQRGKPYSYRVRARFGASEGTGSRVGKRKCQFQFNRTG